MNYNEEFRLFIISSYNDSVFDKVDETCKIMRVADNRTFWVIHEFQDVYLDILNEEDVQKQVPYNIVECKLDYIMRGAFYGRDFTARIGYLKSMNMLFISFWDKE